VVVVDVGRAANVAHFGATATRHLVAAVGFGDLGLARETGADNRLGHLLFPEFKLKPL